MRGMNRKLASIQRIIALDPIPGADRIERATILGWQLVVKKDEFDVGDLAVFYEIDSLLPDLPPYEFMRDKKFRVKTAKFRGQISQGLALPRDVVGIPIWSSEPGTDVTDMLGVTKYEPPAKTQMGGAHVRTFPTFIPRTDETRIQSAPALLEEFWGKEVYITEKVDGTSATYLKYEGQFRVCSRNQEILDERSEQNLYW